MKNTASFTLIELMIVMLVLAILAGLTYPVVLSARRHAREKQAEAEATMIREALKRYIAVYRKWPVNPPPGGGDSEFIFDNLDVIEPLIDPTHTRNPRGQIFLHIQASSIRTNNNQEYLADPFDKPYRICLDTTYDGLVFGHRDNDIVNNPPVSILTNVMGVGVVSEHYSIYSGWVN